MSDDPFTGPASKTYVSQRLKLHYLDWGNPEAPDLFLIHGGMDHAHSFDWIAREFRADWHVMAPDLRGHGDSDWSPDADYSFAAYLYDVAQLIQQRGRPPVTIVAHSMGGVISIRYAAIYPQNVRRLVSIEGLTTMPWAPLGSEIVKPADRLRDWIDTRRDLARKTPRRYATMEEAYERMRANNAQLSDEQVRHLTIHAVLQNEDGTFSWKFDEYVRPPKLMDITQQEETELYAQVACPVMLVSGKQSWMANPEAEGRAAFFPDVRTLSLDGGHWVHHDQTPQVLAAIREFIAF